MVLRTPRTMPVNSSGSRASAAAAAPGLCVGLGLAPGAGVVPGGGGGGEKMGWEA